MANAIAPLRELLLRYRSDGRLGAGLQDEIILILQPTAAAFIAFLNKASWRFSFGLLHSASHAGTVGSDDIGGAGSLSRELSRNANAASVEGRVTCGQQPWAWQTCAWLLGR